MGFVGDGSVGGAVSWLVGEAAAVISQRGGHVEKFNNPSQGLRRHKQPPTLKVKCPARLFLHVFGMSDETHAHTGKTRKPLTETSVITIEAKKNTHLLLCIKTRA